MPLTDITFSVDEIASWDGAAGAGRIPGSDAAIGFASNSGLLVQNVVPGTARALLVSNEIVVTGSTARVVTIAGGTDINCYDEALAAYADAGSAVADYEFHVTADVTTAGTFYALQIDTNSQFPIGCTFVLVNEATIYATGGRGGFGGTVTPILHVNGDAGLSGRNALTVNGLTVDIDNAAGNIWGGGGGGGGGGMAWNNTGPPGDDGAAGSGGGGAVASGVGVTGGTVGGSINSFAGTNADTVTPGIGGASYVANPPYVGGAGGDGGDYGEAGDNGGNASGGAANGTGGAGGAAGLAIDLQGGSVSWIAGNNPAQVKGAIS